MRATGLPQGGSDSPIGHSSAYRINTLVAYLALALTPSLHCRSRCRQGAQAIGLSRAGCLAVGRVLGNERPPPRYGDDQVLFPQLRERLPDRHAGHPVFPGQARDARQAATRRELAALDPGAEEVIHLHPGRPCHAVTLPSCPPLAHAAAGYGGVTVRPALSARCALITHR